MSGVKYVVSIDGVSGATVKAPLRREWVNSRDWVVRGVAVYRQNRYEETSRHAKVVFYVDIEDEEDEENVEEIIKATKTVLGALPFLYAYTTEIVEKLFEFMYVRISELWSTDLEITAHWGSEGDVDVLLLFHEPTKKQQAQGVTKA